MKIFFINVFILLTFNLAAQNIALNKPVHVSSIETPTLVGSNINDGQWTRWSSKWTDNEWVLIDLQSSYNIEKVIINWENARAKAYQILVSDDTLTWRILYSNTADFPKGIYILPVKGYGRYVKLIGLTRQTMYGLSIYELEVYGSKCLDCGQCKIAMDSLNNIIALKISENLTLTRLTRLLIKTNDSLKLANYDIQNQLNKLKQNQFLDSIQFIGFNDSIVGTSTRITEKEYNISPKFTWQILKRYPIKIGSVIKTKEVTITELNR